MLKMITNISEAAETSVGHPMGEGLCLFTIHYAHNCLEDMLSNLHGNEAARTLGSLKRFMFHTDNGCFRNAGGDSHDKWGRVYVWDQTLMMYISINVYLIYELLKTIAYHDSNNIW